MATKSRARRATKNKEDAAKMRRFFAITAICLAVLLVLLFIIYSSI